VEEVGGTHPVFLLTYGGQKVVVKAETVTGSAEKAIERYTAAGEIISALDPKSVSEVLTSRERLAWRNICEGEKATPQMKSSLLDVLAGRAFLVKMRFRKNFVTFPKIAYGATQFDEEQKQVLGKVHALAGNMQFWRSFGKVVAVDFFIGNLDRIGYNPDPVGRETSAKLINPTNIYLKLKGQTPEEVRKSMLIDFFDPYNIAVDFTSSALDETWKEQCAPCLKGTGFDNFRLEKFAVDLVGEVRKHAALADVHARLGEEEALWFSTGFREGKQQMIDWISRNAALTPGVLARAKYLGWQ
jgi:hypothetical protein